MKTNYFNNYTSQGFLVPLAFFLTINTILYPLFGVLSIIIPILLTLFLIRSIDTHLWKNPLFNWMFTIKDISGTYRGRQECHVFIEENNCEKRLIYIDVDIIITQTASEIKVDSFYTYDKRDPSHSKSKFCFISKINDHNYELVYNYENGGKESLDRLATKDKHEGACFSKITIKNGEYFLNGRYYANRKPLPSSGIFPNIKRISKDITHPF
ncbi:hypothetical protein [Tenacibaculum sp. M341]|uniref:hypothetical protein n=1 Tax=Tenacibaculum sp. M341 TaxID=2530339 RepID=UPI0010452E36|nr:hypothetical protein [Tenacibaculum sp. M341]TCI95090.1 hypothetical protein EYW44_01840 [Tenacibaculum sp. M341]